MEATTQDYIVIDFGKRSEAIPEAFALDERGELLELILDGDATPEAPGSWEEEAGICDPWRGANPDLQGALRMFLGQELKRPGDIDAEEWWFKDSAWVYGELLAHGWCQLPSDGGMTIVSIRGSAEGGVYREADRT